MERIGIFAGTFDPVHDGHLALARYAVEQGLVARVVFIPEPSPRFKRPVATLPHRMAMLAHAVQDLKWASVCEVAHDSFTLAATLPYLEAKFANGQLVLLMGSDVVRHLFDWDDPSDRLTRLPLVVGLRKEETIPPAVTRTYDITAIRTQASAISSTAIRSGACGHSQSVIEYVRRHNLY